MFAIGVLAPSLQGGEIQEVSAYDQQVLELRQGETVVRVAPESGANVFSIKVGGVEFLHQPESASRLKGVFSGVPLLYPTPNRVKDSEFTFGDQRVEFAPNAGPNFIHGIVHSEQWQVEDQTLNENSVAITLVLSFENGGKLHNQFPFTHRLRLRLTVAARSVTWKYTVDNSDGTGPVPFGFALHPYFVYQKERAETFLTIPAEFQMEATKQLPSGKLVTAEELDHPLGEPFSLKNTKFDDVFFGINGDTIIDFRDVGRRITIRGDKSFTHLVVWTPQRPFFGVESQTCSTDAHNLHSKGFENVAHLQVCAPGEQLSGEVQYTFQTGQEQNQ
ncbi:MAG: aldose 1-epimerase [Pirellulaceae bacterium]